MFRRLRSVLILLPISTRLNFSGSTNKVLRSADFGLDDFTKMNIISFVKTVLSGSSI